MTASEFIDALGGTSAVAEIAGVTAPAVSNWRKAGVMPPRVYFALAAAARELGVRCPENLFREMRGAA